MNRIILMVALIFLLFFTYGCINHDLKYAREHGRQVSDCIQCNDTEMCKEWYRGTGYKGTYCLKIPEGTVKPLTPEERCQALGGIIVTSVWDGRLKNCIFPEK